MDNKNNKDLHRSAQRAWFVTAEWGINLPGGISLCKPNKRATGLFE